MSAIGAFVIQFLLPFKTKQLFSSLKLVFIELGSEPASLSVNPKQPTKFPLIKSGRYLFFCSFDPKQLIGCITKEDWTDMAER